MNLQKFLFLFFLITYASSNAQDWKKYPYTPTGSLISFPKDEGQHTSEAIEWWYTTGHITSKSTGTNYSYMLSYFFYPYLGFDGFRIFNITNDDTGENLFDTQPVKYDILSTNSLNIKVSNSPLKNPEIWKNKLDTDSKIIPFEYILSASSNNVEINLEYKTIKRPLILGENGKFEQGETKYTYYYSQTKNDVIGTINFNGIIEEVYGSSWIDRQYGTFNPLEDEKYEWLSVQLSNGMDINVWNLFTSDNQIPDNSNYRILSAYVNDETQYTTKDFHMERLKFHFTSDNERCYSQKWRLTSEKNKLDLIIETVHKDSEVQTPFRFYEGSTSITGTVNGVVVTGKGFAELIHTYEKPDISISHPNDGAFNSSEDITWSVNNLDEGNPLLFDVSYSIDNKQSFKTIAEEIKNPFYLWENPDISTGEIIWFKITSYSIDRTLISSSISSISTFTLPIELFNKNNIRFYPNPSNKELLVEFFQNISSLRYQIIDITGKIICKEKVNNINVLKIETKYYKPGLYFIKLRSENKTMQNKFLVK